VDQKYALTLLDKNTKKLNTYDIRTGEIISSDGVITERNKYRYSLEIGDAICSLIREGHTLTKIAAMDGLPSLHLLYKWRNLHPDFKKRLDEARGDRADYYHDKAEAALEDVDEKEDVPVGKLKFDGYMKLAEKGNPTQYGARPPGDKIGALQIIVNTGIIRDDPVTVEVIDVGQDQNTGQGQQSSLQGEKLPTPKEGEE